jgi:hypothetical protein
MPWTAEDRECVLDAKRQIIAGKRLVVVTTSDRSETRQIVKLEELDAILAQIDARISPRPRIFRTRYSKGL